MFFCEFSKILLTAFSQNIVRPRQLNIQSIICCCVGIQCFIQVFFELVTGFPYQGATSPPPDENLLIPPHPSGKIPPLDSTPPPTKVNSPSLNNNFQLVIKNSISSCSHCACSIFVLISYSLNTQVMLILSLIDVQYSQKAFLALKKV